MYTRLNKKEQARRHHNLSGIFMTAKGHCYSFFVEVHILLSNAAAVLIGCALLCQPVRVVGGQGLLFVQDFVEQEVRVKRCSGEVYSETPSSCYC